MEELRINQMHESYGFILDVLEGEIYPLNASSIRIRVETNTMSIHNHRNNVDSGFKDIQNFEYFKSMEVNFDNNNSINSYTIEEFLNMEHYHNDYDIRIESGIIDPEYIGNTYSELEYGRLKIVDDEVIEDILDQIFEINDDFEDIFE